MYCMMRRRRSKGATVGLSRRGIISVKMFLGFLYVSSSLVASVLKNEFNDAMVEDRGQRNTHLLSYSNESELMLVKKSHTL